MERCNWTKEPEAFNNHLWGWKSGCGERWLLDFETSTDPIDDGMIFCTFCGKKINIPSPPNLKE